MKNLRTFLFAFLSISMLFSCGGDSKSDCDGVLNNGGTLEIDNETLNISVAQLLINSGLEGDIYLFQIGGLTDNCGTLKTLSFQAEIAEGSDFDGTYEIKDFFTAGLNDVSSASLTSSNLNAGQQSLIEIESGTVKAKKLANRQYEIDLSGTLKGGGSVEANFKSEF